MTVAAPADFATWVASARGKIVFALADACPPECADAGNFTCAGTENFWAGKPFFEQISAPLVTAGTPWETAWKSISRELEFWFGDASTETCARAAKIGDEAAQIRVSLARALSAKPQSAPLALSATLLSREIFLRLRERARAENFAVVVWGKTLPPPDVFAFDAVAICANAGEEKTAIAQAGTAEEIFRSPASLFVAQKIFSRANAGEAFADNVFSGKLIGTGAGEFFAEIAGAEIRGRLCGERESEPAAGTPIEIFVRAENFRLDAFPPEENFFRVESGGAFAFDGRLFARAFRIAAGTGAARAAAVSRQSLEIPGGDSAFLWFFPDDALGFPVDLTGV